MAKFLSDIMSIRTYDNFLDKLDSAMPCEPDKNKRNPKIPGTGGGWKVPSKRVLTDVQINEIQQRYKAGESGPSLAAEYKVNINTIYRWANKAPIKPAEPIRLTPDKEPAHRAKIHRPEYPIQRVLIQD